MVLMILAKPLESMISSVFWWGERLRSNCSLEDLYDWFRSGGCWNDGRILPNLLSRKKGMRYVGVEDYIRRRKRRLPNVST